MHQNDLDRGATSAYLAALAFYVASRVIDLSVLASSMPAWFPMFSASISLALVALSLLLRRIEIPNLVVYGTVLSVGAVATYESGAKLPFVLCVFIVGMGAVRLESALKVILATVILSVTFVVVLSLIGAVPNLLWPQQGRDRYSLGFRYVLYPSNFLLYATLTLLYVRKGRLRVGEYLGFGLVALAFYIITDSRAAFMLSLTALLVCGLLSRTPTQRSLSKWAIRLSALFFPCLAAGSILTMVYIRGNEEFIRFVDQILGRRLTIMHRSYNKHGITLFGQDVEFVGNGMNLDGTFNSGARTFIDNSFANMAVQYGLIFTALIVLGMSLSMWVIAKSGNSVLLAILVIIGIHSLVDSWFLYIEFNSFILLIGVLLATLVGRAYPNQMFPIATNASEIES